MSLFRGVLQCCSVVHCLAALLVESALEISSCSSGRLAYRTIKTRSSGGFVSLLLTIA